MIQKVIDFIFEHCHLPDKNHCAVNIIVRKPYLLHLHLSNGRSIVIKVIEQSDEHILSNIDREHHALTEQSLLYPGLVPTPIVYQKLGHHVILAMEGIQHGYVSLKSIFQAKQDANRLIQKFLTGKERINSNSHNPNKCIEVLEDACKLLPTSLLPNINKIRQKHRWDETLATFPIIPQHGDLALNNIGLTPTGFILFDWENYAFIDIPGFDLCTILASGCQFNLPKLIATIDNSNNQSFIQPIINSLEINISYLYDLIFIHLILFYQLKNLHGYSEYAIKRTSNMLDQLAQFMLKQ